MGIGKVKVFYFSPTGGTKKVALALSSAWKEVEEIDLTEYGKDFSNVKFSRHDLAIFAMPSYGGRAPQVGMERMRQVKGNGAQAIIAVSYGSRDYEDTLLEMKNLCIENGFQVIGAAEGVTEHSMARKIAEGRPNKKDQRKLFDFANELKIQREEQMSFRDVEVKGNIPYKKISKNPMKPKANNDCIACGECAKNCPVHAISMEDLKTADSDTCICCMRCVQVCPRNARGIGSIASKTVELAMKKVCSKNRECEGYYKTV